ncbi:GMC family oxidoreductase, partial [Intrasporangium sp.]|uniref:GMC family oxidoreductase n=1 Tax=Intrasporangium sp. TaxID=1925024 RepID=UPI0032216329
GAGAAGCVVAERLSRDRGSAVVLVEAGRSVRHPLVRVPKGFVLAMQRSGWTYRYPARTADGGRETWVRGRALGGSTVVNGMMYLRGEPTGQDEIAARGLDGWDATAMTAAYDALERPVSAGRDDPGLLDVTVPRWAQVGDEVLEAVVASAETLGLPFVPDLNAGAGPRLGVTPSTIAGGRRVSAATAFLAPARGRPNLTVLPGTRAGRIMLAGGRAVGAVVRRGGATREVRARRETIVCAGTVESPVLLERSGIGRPEVLARIGVPVQVASPRVGEGVVEQRAVTLKARLSRPVGLGSRLGTPVGRARAAGRYLATGRGPLAVGAYELAGLVDTRGDGRPDAQVLVTSLATDETGLAVSRDPGLMVVGYALRPTTVGSVHAGGADPDDLPVIAARFLQTEADRAAAERILRWEQRLLAVAPVAGLVAEVTAPWPGVDAVSYAALTGSGIYHAVGSCAMGPDESDVLDCRLRVRGIDGLRVADASVFPSHPSGGMAAPSMAAGWRAADLVEEER